MADQLLEPQFLSPYAPFQPDGPLPPGLNESTVKATFQKQDLRHVLAMIGIPRSTGSPEKRLRKALDDPQLRTRLAEHQCRHCGKQPLVFHSFLHFYLRNSPHARGIYNRLVQPAEYGDSQGKIFLDAGRFARRLDDEKHEIGEVVAPITPRSAEEALAQFALAFALLQPQEAYEILHPLLLMGQSYQDFFGATLTSTSESLEHHRESTPVRETHSTPIPQATAYPNESQTTGTSSVTTALSQESGGLKSESATASETESKASVQTVDIIAEGSASNTEAISASEEDVSSTKAQVRMRVAEYERCRAIADLTRVQRQRLGGAPELDRKAFEEAASKETEALKAVKSLEEAHASEVYEILSRATAMLLHHLESVALTGPTGADPQSVARWLDDADVWLIDLDAQDQVIGRKLSLLRELDRKQEISPSKAATCTTFKAAFEFLEQRADDLDKIIGKA